MSVASTSPGESRRRRLLIVYHTQFGGTEQMAEAARAGADAIEGVDTALAAGLSAGLSAGVY